jgi:hypothetical protein
LVLVSSVPAGSSSSSTRASCSKSRMMGLHVEAKAQECLTLRCSSFCG